MDKALMNSEHYPWLCDLGSPEAKAALDLAALSFHSAGVATFPHFLTPDTLAAAQAEVQAKLSRTLLPDSLSTGEPPAVLGDVSSVAFDELYREGPLVRLYEGSVMVQLVAAVTGAAACFPSADPLLRCAVHVLRPGRGHAPALHCSDSEFCATLMLQEAEDGVVGGGGGGGGGGGEPLVPGPGTLSIAAGAHSLQHIADAAGTRSPLVAVFAFCSTRGHHSSSAVQESCTGRVKLPGLDYASACTLPTVWVDLPVLAVHPYNHDTSIFTFGLPGGSQGLLGLPACSSLLAMAPGADHDGSDAVRPYTPISPSNRKGSFDLLIKRYDEWGQKCPQDSIFAFFSYNVTQHAYKPRGAMSNHIFNLRVGDSLKFRHIEQNLKIQYPFTGVATITMIAVGVGVSPMIQALHELLLDGRGDSTKIILLYGVRTVKDILLREMLEDWAIRFSDRFRIVYGVGSRYNNAIFGAKTTDQCIKPPPPRGFEDLRVGEAELGWIDEDKIRRYAHPPAVDTRVFVCGLPGVYDHLCGPRSTPDIRPGSALHNVGYSSEMVVKF